jgi:hypothetical protein
VRSWHPLVRWTLIVFAALVVISVAALAGLVSLEWTYIRRLRSHPKNLITDVAWYQPRETVAGGNGPAVSRAAPGDRGMSSVAIEAATNPCSGHFHAPQPVEESSPPIPALPDCPVSIIELASLGALPTAAIHG